MLVHLAYLEWAVSFAFRGRDKSPSINQAGTRICFLDSGKYGEQSRLAAAVCPKDSDAFTTGCSQIYICKDFFFCPSRNFSVSV